jgi:hypothetical protein
VGALKSRISGTAGTGGADVGSDVADDWSAVAAGLVGLALPGDRAGPTTGSAVSPQPAAVHMATASRMSGRYLTKAFPFGMGVAHPRALCSAPVLRVDDVRYAKTI